MLHLNYASSLRRKAVQKDVGISSSIMLFDFHVTRESKYISFNLFSTLQCTLFKVFLTVGM